MSAPIVNNTEELQDILDQVNNLPSRSTSGASSDCVVKSDIATDDDVLGFIVDMGYINPASSGTNTIYTDNNGVIYTI